MSSLLLLRLLLLWCRYQTIACARCMAQSPAPGPQTVTVLVAVVAGRERLSIHFVAPRKKVKNIQRVHIPLYLSLVLSTATTMTKTKTEIEYPQEKLRPTLITSRHSTEAVANVVAIRYGSNVAAGRKSKNRALPVERQSIARRATLTSFT